MRDDQRRRIGFALLLLSAAVPASAFERLSGTVELDEACQAAPIVVRVNQCCQDKVDGDRFEVTLTPEASDTSIFLFSIMGLPEDCDLAFPPMGFLPVLKPDNIRLFVVSKNVSTATVPVTRGSGVEEKIQAEILSLSDSMLAVLKAVEGLSGDMGRRDGVTAELLRQEYEKRQGRYEVLVELQDAAELYTYGLKEVWLVFERYVNDLLTDYDSHMPLLDDAIGDYNKGFDPLDTKMRGLVIRAGEAWDESAARRLGEIYRRIRDRHDELILGDLLRLKNDIYKVSTMRAGRANRIGLEKEIRAAAPRFIDGLRAFERQVRENLADLILDLRERADAEGGTRLGGA